MSEPVAEKHRYFIVNKPYGMVSQFVSSDKVTLLSDLDFHFPEGTHAIGRLDSNTEGLLILTTNKKVTRLLFMSQQPHNRTYLLMVRNKVSAESIEKLQTGVCIDARDRGPYTTQPCQVRIVTKPENLFEGHYPNAERQIHDWLEITLTEGKFHQVRKMVKAVNHPCKRLIRISIEELELGHLQPGEVKELAEDDFFRKLNIAPMAYLKD